MNAPVHAPEGIDRPADAAADTSANPDTEPGTPHRDTQLEIASDEDAPNPDAPNPDAQADDAVLRKPTGKAPEAYRTISEVADALDVPQHVLRFWETKFTQVKPLKRAGGRRYYRPDDVVLLQGIRHLLYGEGYTLRGVQRILREKGVRSVKAIGGTVTGEAIGDPPPKHKAVHAASSPAGTSGGEAPVGAPVSGEAATDASNAPSDTHTERAPPGSGVVSSGAEEPTAASAITPRTPSLSASARARLEDALRTLDRAESVLLAQVGEPGEDD